MSLPSGVGGGVSGASADALTVGHRWQSDTHALKKKKGEKEAEERKRANGDLKKKTKGKRNKKRKKEKKTKKHKNGKRKWDRK